MTIGEVRELASIARHRGDHRVAELLHREAAARVEAAVRQRTDGTGVWWPSTTEIPVGVEFTAVSPHCDVTWRREPKGCRALPPVGTDRVYADWLIDQAWSREGYGFIPASVTSTQIARQHQ
ncbi:hypothetical protein [Nocardia otitidiscaviarum]|uniref:hypothetical protein n=1 Tax=Nocardia otitidiscaviarum TaxID=1823 RepID=UPI0004A6E488|nr:hypothetical protein [Nocardia otitidiscaviarum]